MCRKTIWPFRTDRLTRHFQAGALDAVTDREILMVSSCIGNRDLALSFLGAASYTKVMLMRFLSRLIIAEH